MVILISIVEYKQYYKKISGNAWQDWQQLIEWFCIPFIYRVGMQDVAREMEEQAFGPYFSIFCATSWVPTCIR